MKMTREEANEILEDWNLCHYTPSREAAEAVISALDPLEIISALRLVSREQVERMRGVGEKGGPAMTREKAITILQREKDCVQQAIQNAVYGDGYVSPDGMIRAEDYVEACVTALTALRPVSREQVEKVWRGVWKHYLPPLGAGNIQCRCTKCGRTPDVETPFCAWCGAPMTDEAVEMVMERLEALKDGKGD